MLRIRADGPGRVIRERVSPPNTLPVRAARRSAQASGDAATIAESDPSHNPYLYED